MTLPPDKSDRIESSGAIKPERPVPQTAPGSNFESFMQGSQGSPQSGAGAAPTQGANAAAMPGGGAMQTPGPSYDSLLAQVSTSQDSVNNLQNKMNTPDLRFKRSQSHLLRNKLSDASTYLRAANAKLGVETPPMPTAPGSGPIERFVNYLSDGQNQLLAAKNQLMQLKNSGDNLRPSDFLLVQIKLSQAQQELEYSSVLLSKVVDSIKTTLNTPL